MSKDITQVLRNLRMSTTEVAALTGKLPKTVNRDAKTLLDKLEKAGVDVSGAVIERDNRGYIQSIQLDKVLTFTLITGYDVVLRHAVMDRWVGMEEELATYGYLASDEWYRLDLLVDRFCQLSGAANPLIGYEDNHTWPGYEKMRVLDALSACRPYMRWVSATQKDDDSGINYATFPPAQFYFTQKAGIIDVMFHLFGVDAANFYAQLKHNLEGFLEGLQCLKAKDFKSRSLFKELREVPLLGTSKYRRVTRAQYEAECAAIDKANDEGADLDYDTFVQFID